MGVAVPPDAPPAPPIQPRRVPLQVRTLLPLIIIPDLFPYLSRSRVNWHRPTQPAQWWTPGEEGKEILGGRDELGGGTWMGCTRDGKLAFLTNVREPSLMAGAKTRGDLPVRFLQVRPCHCCSFLHLVMSYLLTLPFKRCYKRRRAKQRVLCDCTNW